MCSLPSLLAGEREKTYAEALCACPLPSLSEGEGEQKNEPAASRQNNRFRGHPYLANLAVTTVSTPFGDKAPRSKKKRKTSKPAGEWRGRYRVERGAPASLPTRHEHAFRWSAALCSKTLCVQENESSNEPIFCKYIWLQFFCSPFWCVRKYSTTPPRATLPYY